MERKTHTLLEKFVRNSITSQEGKELKDSVAKMSDEELTQIKPGSPFPSASFLIYFSQSCGCGYHTGFARNSNIFLL